MPAPSPLNPSGSSWSFAFAVSGFIFGGGALYLAVFVALDNRPTEQLACQAFCAVLVLGGLGLGVYFLIRGVRESQLQQQIRRETGVDLTLLPRGLHWEPPDDLTDHEDEPLAPDADFFVPPPESIGPLFSAHSSRTKNAKPFSLIVCVLIVVVAGVGGAGFAYGVSWLPPRNRGNRPVAPSTETARLWYAVTGGVGGLVFGIGAHASRWSRCSYVGAEGVARFACVSQRDRLTFGEVFLFRNAAALYTHKKIQSGRYGGYLNTNVRFDWVDAEGRPLFQIAGTYGGEGDNAGSEGVWGLAAEAAWTAYQMRNAEEVLEGGGAVAFYPGGVEWVRVGRGFLVVCHKGNEVRLERDDIGEAREHKGVVTLRRGEGSVNWLPDGPVYRWAVLRMPDRHFFQEALCEWMDVTWK